MQLRNYQIEAVESIYYHMRHKHGNPIVAAPTGTGKSLIIAGFIKRVHLEHPETKILMLTHVQELIEQNLNKLKELWPSAPVGIYSAGLNQKTLGLPIIFGGIQSLYGKGEELGKVDIVVIDECHMVSPRQETTYMKLINDLLMINPLLKVIGFTATAFRLGLGMLTQGGLFDDICWNGCSKDKFNWFIENGYLSRLVPKSTATVLDLHDVTIRRGDFVEKELQQAVNKHSITIAAIEETLEVAGNRKHWLIFSSGLDHAKAIAEALEDYGISATWVSGDLKKDVRKERIDGFKSGKYQAMVNYGVLTTGFDFSGIDLIIMLRPTMSPVLWVQMLGRGTRIDPEKENCMVLDFASNTVRLGPINDPVIPRKRGEGGGGTAPVKLCPTCGTYIHASIRVCPECGFEFPPNLTDWRTTASTAELIASVDAPLVVDHPVNTVTYSVHHKEGKPPSMKVTYICGYRRFDEYICFEHGGFPTMKAKEWWRSRIPTGIIPPTTEIALLASKFLPAPKAIKVWEKKKNPEVRGYVF